MIYKLFLYIIKCTFSFTFLEFLSKTCTDENEDFCFMRMLSQKYDNIATKKRDEFKFDTLNNKSLIKKIASISNTK